MKIIKFIANIAICLVFLMGSVSAMSFLGFKVVLATEMKGTVVLSGQPAVGAVVRRVVQFDNKEYSDEVQVDNDGGFVIPELTGRTLWKHTPFEVLIPQEVTISYQGEKHLGLQLTKRNFDRTGEFNNFSMIEAGHEKLIDDYQFVCDLADEEYKRRFPESGKTVYGKCLHVSEKE